MLCKHGDKPRLFRYEGERYSEYCYRRSSDAIGEGCTACVFKWSWREGWAALWESRCLWTAFGLLAGIFGTIALAGIWDVGTWLALGFLGAIAAGFILLDLIFEWWERSHWWA